MNIVTTTGSFNSNADKQALFAAIPSASPTLYTPAEIIAQQILRIKAKRDLLIGSGGYKVNVAGVDKWFHSDIMSRSQQIGLVMLGVNIPAGLQWKTMDKSFVPMTQTLAQQIFGAAAASDQAIFATAETLIAGMMSSADPASYDITSGWPVTFLG